MKMLSWAIASLGVWVILNAFISAVWDDIVFGAIAAILALWLMYSIAIQTIKSDWLYIALILIKLGLLLSPALLERIIKRGKQPSMA